MWLWLLLLFSCSCAWALSPSERTLAENGRSQWKIVLLPGSHRLLHTAAGELALHLAQSTGAQFPIVEANMGQLADRSIVLACEPDAPGLPSSLQGYSVSISKQGISILGRTPHAVLYGAYEFLEREVGCRWFAPEETFIPKRETLKVRCTRYTGAPVFAYRELYAKDVFADRLWAQRLRINGGCASWPDHYDDHLYNYLPGYSVHTFGHLVPPEEHFDAHPEYYGITKGQRNKNILCLSNPEVFDVALARLKKDLASFPDRPVIISVSQNDCGGWCECPRCRRIIEQEENGVPTGLLIRFINRFDEALKNQHVLIHTLAYHDTDAPPSVTKPNPNVIVQLCPIGICYAHAPGECQHTANIQFAKNLRGWSKIHENLWIWSYHVNFFHVLQPFPNMYTLGAYFRYFADHHATGVFAQGDAMNPSASLSKLRNYVIAKILWNPYQKGVPLMDEFLEGYYREAAPTMKKYLDLLQSTVDRKPQYVTWIYEGPLSPHFSIEFVLAAEKIFDAGAQHLVPDSLAAQRLETERLSSYYMVLEFWKAGRISRRAQDILSLIDRLEAGCNRSGVRGLTEHDWKSEIKQEWFRDMRERAARQLQQETSKASAEADRAQRVSA